MKKLTYLALYTLFSILSYSGFSQSDTTPPIPISFSFSPDTINTTNGDQSISVSLRVTDDLSGVESVLIYWLDPLGNNNIYTAWTIDPASNDITLTGTTDFPKGSPAGDWVIDRIALKDRVNDFKEYSTDELKEMGISANLHVISISDTEPPIPVSFSFSPDTINTTNEDQNVSISLRVTDDISGVETALVYWLDPLGNNTIHTAWTIDPPSIDKTLTGTTLFPKGSPAGDWKIDRIVLKDQVNDFKSYYTDELKEMGISADLHVISITDTENPIPVSFSFSPDTINTINEDQNVSISLRVTDDLSGVETAIVYWLDPLGNNTIHTAWTLNPPSIDKTLMGTTLFPKGSPVGDWKIDRIVLKDQVNDLKSYNTDELKEMGISAKLVNDPGSTSHPIGVTTLAASEITNNSANLNGFVCLNGGQHKLYFGYGEGDVINQEIEVGVSLDGIYNSSFNTFIQIADLAPNTKYSYRLVSKDFSGQVQEYGTTLSFTTLENRAPVIQDSTYHVIENQDEKSIFAHLLASDPDGDMLTYQILSGNDDTTFSISTDGNLILEKTLDYESKNEYSLAIEASDGYLSDNASIKIMVNDRNEAPVASDSTYMVGENTSVHALIGEVKTTDPENNDLTYSITSGNDDDIFSINSEGKLFLEKKVDFESKEQHSLSVDVSDGEFNTIATILVNVENVNEAPVLDLSSYSIPENASISSEIGKLVTSDPENDDLTYSITSGNEDGVFSISSDGIIILESSVDYENITSYTLSIEISDGELSSKGDITINVDDVNDEAPANILFDNSDESFVVIGELQTVGQLQIQLSSEDPDSDTFTYLLIEGEGSDNNEAFEITGSNLSNKVILDDQDKVYKIRVKSSDGAQFIEEQFEIKVQVVATAINEVKAMITKVYPNPTSDVLHLILSNDIHAELNYIQIIGLDGKVYPLKNPPLTRQKNIQIDVSNLACGTYILRCVHRKGIDTIKFTKK